MPFVVVETVDARGRKELSIVPEKWVRDTQNEKIVFWPNAKRISEQEALQRDDKSCPKKSWMVFSCTVKGKSNKLFSDAKRLLDELSGESSTDVSHRVPRKRKKEPEINFQKILTLENEPQSSSESPVRWQSVSDENFHITTAPDSPLQNTDCEGNDQETQFLYGTLAEPHVEIIDEDPIEVKELHLQIIARLDNLEKRVAEIFTQNEFILNTIRNVNALARVTEEEPPFGFKPVENEQNLADLEQKLADKEFKTKMVKWLRLNVYGDCADSRMLCVLDLLLSRVFQTMCTWTGASRKGPKIAIMPNRNILQLFQLMGSDENEIVTQRKMQTFFMRTLKNSVKRLSNKGMRRGTRHVRRNEQHNDKRADFSSAIMNFHDILSE
ncbi:uncharacterized protein LOC129760782 [Uranotaenia lowii]|uniref:uncharacterized protein LOC129760782 n=1 Tax=Uranotaenia lowii TaxID=190385 RepID=UPI002478E6A5|nr:uncharacterized protein LOC129760782 [Uranotaenia lowii]